MFVLIRNKSLPKILNRKGEVLEVGCCDAFGTRMVQQHVAAVTAVDFAPLFVKDANDRISD